MDGNGRGLVMEMVRVKAEPLHDAASLASVSKEARQAGLYLDHEIKDELVLGPVVVQPVDAMFTANVTPPISYDSRNHPCNLDHTYVKTKVDLHTTLEKHKTRAKMLKMAYLSALAEMKSPEKNAGYQVKTAKLVSHAKRDYQAKMVHQTYIGIDYQANAKLDNQAKMNHQTKTAKVDCQVKVDQPNQTEDPEVEFVCEVPAPLPAEPTYDDSCVLVRAPAPALAHVVKVEPLVEHDASAPPDALFKVTDVPQRASCSDTHSPTPSHPIDELNPDRETHVNNIDLKVFNYKTGQSNINSDDTFSQRQIEIDKTKKGNINHKLLRKIHTFRGLTDETRQRNGLKSLLKSNNIRKPEKNNLKYEPLNTIVYQSDHNVTRSYREIKSNETQTNNELRTQTNLRIHDLSSTDEHRELTQRNKNHKSQGLIKVRSAHKINQSLSMNLPPTIDFVDQRNKHFKATNQSRTNNHEDFNNSQRKLNKQSLLKTNYTKLTNNEAVDTSLFDGLNNFEAITKKYRNINQKMLPKTNQGITNDLKTNSPKKGNEQVETKPCRTLDYSELNNSSYEKYHVYTDIKTVAIEYTENDNNSENNTDTVHREYNDSVATESKNENDIDLNLTSYETNDKVIYYSDYESFFLKSVDMNNIENDYGDNEESEYTSHDNEIYEMKCVEYENYDTENGDSEIVASYTEIGECVCALCNETFADKAQLVEHVVIHIHTPACEKQGPCVENDNASDRTASPTSTQKRKMKRKRRMKLGRTSVIPKPRKIHACDLCERTFSKYSRLVLHRRIHTNERPYPCQLCEKAFTDASSLRKHLTIHTGEKPYACKVCKKHFHRRYNLKTHERIHTGEKPYSCSVCKMKFTQVNAVRRHERIHTGQKPFPCCFCSKTFGSVGPKNRHERIHTGEKPYTCNVCGRTFTESGALKKHEIVHTGEKRFHCDICTKAFTRKYNLIKHIIENHQ